MLPAPFPLSKNEYWKVVAYIDIGIILIFSLPGWIAGQLAER